MASKKIKIDEFELPHYPSELWSPLGMVDIELKPGLADVKTEELVCGIWHNSLRKIQIRADMHPVATWQTIAHEQFHQILHDAGAQLPQRQEEAVCDAYGSFIAAWITNGGEFPFGK